MSACPKIAGITTRTVDAYAMPTVRVNACVELGTLIWLTHIMTKAPNTMKTIDEIIELADGYAECPCQAIIDALYEYEDTARARILELEIELEELRASIGHATKKVYSIEL